MSNTWDKRWMDMAALVATWSKDKSRRTAAVIVDERNCVVSLGWNGFPRGLFDDIPERHERPAKYQWTEHAERNAIYNAAANGHPVKGCTMYLPWFPCADCGRAIIQAGIRRLVCYVPDWDDPNWGSDFVMVAEMLKEAGVVIQYIDGKAPKIGEAQRVDV